jgi:hypothetical protein
MNTINFSVVEILPALLDKTKTQTIRKAWKLEPLKYKHVYPNGLESNKLIVEKPARFKVGEKVLIAWTGNMDYLNQLCSNPRQNIVANLKEFLFGEAEITEVFKITMINEKYCEDRATILDIYIEGKEHRLPRFHNANGESNRSLALRDGFETWQDMWKCFDKMYDLSTPKEFWVYRWRWL